MPPPFPDYVRLVQAFKEYFLDFFDGTFGPPFILIERAGAISHILLTRAAGPHEAMPVVRTLYAMVPHDALILVVEASTKLMTSYQGETMDEALAAARRDCPAGTLQDLIDQGKAGEHGIVDTLMALRIAAADRSVTMHTLPYFYSGEHTPFAWFPSQFKWHAGQDGNRLGGDVHDALLRAYSGPRADDLLEVVMRSGAGAFTPEDIEAIGNRAPAEVAELFADYARLAPDRVEQLQTAATLEYLESQGCAIFTSFASSGIPRP